MFSKFFKVFKRRYTKNVFATLLVSVFVVMTSKLIPIDEHDHIEKGSIKTNLEEYFEFRPIPEKNIETRKKQNKTSDPIQSKLKEAVIYNSKITTMTSSEKPSTISKCGYDVS